MNLFLLLGAAFFIYALIYKPEFVAILLFTFIIANVNFDIKALPLNSRALITLALFGRILFDKAALAKYPSFLSTAAIKYFILFMLYTLFISFSQDLFNLELLKQTVSTVLAAFCVYHFFFLHNDSRHLKVAMIIAGIICFSDLAYTYVVFGSFPVQRIHLIFTDNPLDVAGDDFDGVINHNFFGQVCGMCFVFIFCDFIKNQTANKLMMFLLPVMFLGVLMSTSRSALLGILVVAIFVIAKGVISKEQKKKVYKIGTITIGTIALGILLFTTLGKSFNLDGKFLDQVVYRLTEEPLAMLKRAFGQSYNIQNLGSMDWREESAANAYAAYLNLNVEEQLFGIGYGGFLERDLGHGLNPHNGILLILIEYGLIGFCFYAILIAGAIIRAIRLKNISPSFAVLAFILVYGVGQNGELTSSMTFLFFASLVAENKFLTLERSRSTLV